jgi:hypothetical protein
MGVIGFDDEQPGVAASEQLVVEPPAVDDDVREPTVVPIALLDVGFELHRPPRQVLPGERGRLGPEAFDGLGRVVRFRGIGLM